VINTPAAWSRRAETAATSWDAAGWSEAGQHDRLVKAIELLEPRPGELLLDFGCGDGALVDHLPAGVHSLGFDSAPGMVARARLLHDEHRFLDWEPAVTVDLVACVGPFNLADHWSKQHTWATLRRLWEHTRRRLVVMLYAGTVTQHCLVYGRDETRRHVGGLSHDVTVSHWRSNDIAAVVTR